MIKSYYEIFTKVWRLFRDSFETAKTIKDPADPRWIQICDRFEAIEKDAPPEYRWYAGSMALLQVDMLERMCRK
ncbi:MAG: hypothetical protein Q4C03_08200 [bacterium]|nr:hypothetical protein [bacterium]